jgi:hypothetical protein
MIDAQMPGNPAQVHPICIEPNRLHPYLSSISLTFRFERILALTVLALVFLRAGFVLPEPDLICPGLSVWTCHLFSLSYLAFF